MPDPMDTYATIYRNAPTPGAAEKVLLQRDLMRYFDGAGGRILPLAPRQDEAAECACCERVLPGAPGAGGSAWICNECGGQR